MIVCLLLPYFAATVERMLAPALSPAPLILSEPFQHSARVFAISAEAARQGVRPGMSITQAHALCSQLQIIPAQPLKYQALLDDIAALLTNFTSKVEPVLGAATALVYSDVGDFSGSDQLELAEQMNRQVVTELALTPALGLALGKFPAYLAAASIGLNRVLLIAPGEEASFVAPLPVSYLPLERELARRFHLLGLRTLGQFAGLPAGVVLTQFGRYGHWLHQLAQGRDDRPVLSYQAQPTEQLAYAWEDPITDRTRLLPWGRVAAQELAGRLAGRGLAAQGLELTLHLEDGRQWAKPRALRQLIQTQEQLNRQVSDLLTYAQVSGGVVGLAVKLTGLTPVIPRQLDLFVNPTRLNQERQFEAALPGLIAQYGPEVFYELSLINPLAPLPEDRFRLQPLRRR